MPLRLIIYISAAVLLAAATQKAPGAAFGADKPTSSGYVMTFHDEFDGESLDPGKWRTAYHWGAATTINKELAFYVDTQDSHRPITNVDPFTLKNGVLTIQAAKNVEGGLPYTSGVITTQRSFSQTYGYFEARMKMPSGEGAWPTFWLVAANKDWPPELDVVEMVGQRPTVLLATEHDAVDGHDVSKHCYPTVSDMTQDFHKYGLLWTATDLTWYFDDNVVCHLSTQPSQHTPMYIIMNLAIGSGGWTGAPSTTTPFPQSLQVDYVRTYAPGPKK